MRKLVWSPAGPIRWLAVYQLICVYSVSLQLHSSAVDFTHEALRLLEEEPETTENADRLKDDKAHAFLWLYVCTLEKNLHEVSTVKSVRISCTYIQESLF